MMKSLTEESILKKINKLASDFERNNSHGFAPILYTNKKFQRVFIKAIVKHGPVGSKVHQEIDQAEFLITRKTIQGYLRRLFGTYGKRGRPSKYMQDKGRK